MPNKQPSTINSRIEKLDNRLANQIAAGEVVDRPASVLKELLENCVDAGASRIEVEIERGGTRLIRVTDDGSGINKDDLTLALTRHATSKIKTVEDLSAIYSLGFRGEALASISSVSRLTLTSRTHDDEHAWQAVSEGRDMAVDIQPASAIAGTRIEVRDLFFNTPARQKFLRTERTEFFQIEDVFKRMALSSFDISFILKHNGKIIKRVPAVKLLNIEQDRKIKYLISEQERSRLAILCGKPFADLSLAVKCKHENISIKAFVGGVNYHRSESDIQYVFINNRAVKDKTLTHAIRQAYQNRLPLGRMPTYVIFLTIDANKVDVNVHPTKHEVRFENQREVHDLLFHSISEALDNASEIKFELNDNESSSLNNRSQSTEISKSAPNFNSNSKTQSYSKERIYLQSIRNSNTQHRISDNFRNYPRNDFVSSESNEVKDDFSNSSILDFTRLGDGFSFFKLNSNIWIIKELPWLKKCFIKFFEKNLNLPTIALLFPENFEIDPSKLEDVKINMGLIKIGFNFSPGKGEQIQLNGIPVWSKNIGKEEIFSFFRHCINNLSIKSNVYDIIQFIDDWMISPYLMSYFLNLNILDFEIELAKTDSFVRKIDSEFAKVLFHQKKVVLKKEQFERDSSNVAI